MTTDDSGLLFWATLYILSWICERNTY